MFKKFHLSAIALASAAVLSLLPGTGAAQQSLTVASWGGAYTVSQVESMHKPFEAKISIKVVSVDYSGALAEIAAQVKTGNIKWDVIDLEPAEALKGCEEGLFECQQTAGRRRRHGCIQRLWRGLVTALRHWQHHLCQHRRL